MNLSFRKIRFISIFLFIILLLFVLKNSSTSNSIYAGQVFSEFKKTSSSEKICDSSEKEIEILIFKINDLSKQINLILQNIDRIEKSLLSHLKIQSKNNSNVAERNSSFLKFQISFLKQKKSLLKKQLNEIILEKIDLEIKLRKILYSDQK
ncbi:effector protein [Candidatus Phytoplasma sacchari]|uniref:Effector protein n=1 Tax=Candidatus Phytoplasma sacchari TaxID=2609813 RepID=A0ABY7M1J7_9MOLU|nr:effector protein [Candidatus Phytoplasma sacchari]